MAQWFTEGKKTNPGANVVLADTGPLVSQEWRVTLVGTANIRAAVLLQHRNVANDTTLKEQWIVFLADATLSPQIIAISLHTANERIRIVTDTVLVGNIQVSIFLEG